MGWEGWLTAAVLVLVVFALAREIAGTDTIVLGGLVLLALAGVVSPKEAFAGFANEAMLTVAALFVLASALRETGALEALFGRIFGRTQHERTGLVRMLPPIAGLSAFLNNTTIVAMMTPVVMEWSRRNRLSASRFLIPMDYATILGGVVTIIGTSTNLVVAGQMITAGMEPMGFFELVPVGLPVAVVGILFLIYVAPSLLPDRRDPVEEFGEKRREYTAAMIVQAGSPLVGQTVEEAGLRHLPGLFLVEIDREGRVVTPVASDERLQARDRLVFAGVVATIVDLQRLRGLVPATETVEAAPSSAPDRRLTEAVVSHSSPLVGRSIREASFRTVYDAAVIAVHRNGERVGGRIGDIVLRPGDALLLQTAPGFLRVHRNSPDFYLVSELADTEPPRYDRAWVAVVVLLAMVGASTLEILPTSVSAFAAAGVLVATRSITGAQARRSVDLPLLVTIGAAFGLGVAMEKTGLALAFAQSLTAPAGAFGPVAALAAVYFATLVLTEVITNNAAAALMFPIAVATANELGVDPRGFAMAVCVAASCGFATPFGYQTHLIVYGPGGYRFADFVRVGVPLDLISMVVAVAVIPFFWPM